jgi:hypothetical protein
MLLFYVVRVCLPSYLGSFNPTEAVSVPPQVRHIDESPQGVWRYFIAGPPGPGLPFHSHGEFYNSLVCNAHPHCSMKSYSYTRFETTSNMQRQSQRRNPCERWRVDE